MQEEKLYQKLIKRIGKTNSLLIKGFISVFLPELFFNAFYSCAAGDKKFSNIATISFDCDHIADIEALPILLEILNSYGVKASFACVGKLIEKYPREHRMIIEEGHEIINHTYTHPFNKELNSLKRFDKLTKDEQRDEIIQCHKVCKFFLNYKPIGFRIPHFGVQYTDTIYEILSELGYAYSSSILAIKTTTFGGPYLVGGILELPVITCPKHPFQAFDTYHAFRSRITSHDEKDFCNIFMQILDLIVKKSMYLNICFDPQDAIHLDYCFKEILRLLKNSKLVIKMYRDVIR